MKKIAKNIEWDVDNKEELEDLPCDIEIPEGMEDEEEISDYLSDLTGFCHNGYEIYECEYAVEITDETGGFLRGVAKFDDYAKAAQYANAVNHDKDVLGDNEFVRVLYVEYYEGDEVGTNIAKDFERNEPDANELFADVLEAVHCSLDPCEKGYLIYDREVDEYRENNGEDVVVTDAIGVAKELEAIIDDSFYNDLADKMKEDGLVKENEVLPQTLRELYIHIVLLANEEADGEGSKFWDKHEEELSMVSVICERIEEVDLALVCPENSLEQTKSKANESKKEKNGSEYND